MEVPEHGGKRAGAARDVRLAAAHRAAMVNIKTANLDREEAKS